MARAQSIRLGPRTTPTIGAICLVAVCAGEGKGKRGGRGERCTLHRRSEEKKHKRLGGRGGRGPLCLSVSRMLRKYFVISFGGAWGELENRKKLALAPVGASPRRLARGCWHTTAAAAATAQQEKAVRLGAVRKKNYIVQKGVGARARSACRKITAAVAEGVATRFLLVRVWGVLVWAKKRKALPCESSGAAARMAGGGGYGVCAAARSRGGWELCSGCGCGCVCEERRQSIGVMCRIHGINHHHRGA